MTHTLTQELRAHRRAHQLNQDELAHLIGVTPAMIHRIENGADAQLADIEMMLGLELVFGKGPSELFAAFYTKVVDAVMRRAVELEAVWLKLGDAKSKTNLAFLDELVGRAKITVDDV